ncbi:hypothetical protein ACQP2F_37350 [Actinoplanes sp. CA-030573]|uniref:hypothetical protein n=1 Tax=Actinoplanes sp. CA-030573 TaxID=3239898 RepID=UPI003D8E1C08
MNATTGEPDDAPIRDDALPDVTRIPLRRLTLENRPALKAAIDRLVDDLTDAADITAGFTNVP